MGVFHADLTTRSWRRLVTVVVFLCWASFLCLSPAKSFSDQRTAGDGKGRWNTWATDDGLPENEVRCIFEDSRGNLWFGTRREGIGVFNGTSWTYYTADDGLVSNGITAIVQDARGRVWTAGGGGYSILEGDRWTPHDSLGAVQPRVVYSIDVDWKGHLWLGANGGASGFDGSAWRHFTPEDGLPHPVVHAALQDRRGNVWFACRQGLARHTGIEMRLYHADTNFGSILEDDAGRLWFGTRTKGAFVYDGADWLQHLPGRDLRPSLVDGEGRVWAVTDDSGAWLYDGETWINYGSEAGLASDTVFDLLEVRDGGVWFATPQGASVLTSE
jgi:ligand-binding sensor domain-containing protein